MEININKINERLHDEFPFSRTNLIVRDQFICVDPVDCYTVELIVDDKHVKRTIPKKELLSLNSEMAQFYVERMFDILITTLRGYREDQNGRRDSSDS